MSHAIMLAHSVFADLVCLASTQDTFLRDRATDLAEYAGQVRDGDTAEVAAKYLVAQAQLIDFLGSLWFQEVPRRDSATRVLRSMQSARYLPDRLAHIEREHASFLRYLEAREKEARDAARERRVEAERREEVRRTARQAQFKEAERREEARAAELRAQREEAEKREAARVAALQSQRDETTHVIQLIAAVILPTTLVFTITGGTGIELNLWAIVSAVVVSVLLTVFFVPRRAVSDLRRGWSRYPGDSRE